MSKNINVTRIPIIAIPHQLPAQVWYVLPESIANYESCARDENGDLLEDEMLHDLNTWVRLEDAAEYRGHQQARVRILASENQQ